MPDLDKTCPRTLTSAQARKRLAAAIAAEQRGVRGMTGSRYAGGGYALEAQRKNAQYIATRRARQLVELTEQHGTLTAVTVRDMDAERWTRIESTVYYGGGQIVAVHHRSEYQTRLTDEQQRKLALVFA